MLLVLVYVCMYVSFNCIAGPVSCVFESVGWSSSHSAEVSCVLIQVSYVCTCMYMVNSI